MRDGWHLLVRGHGRVVLALRQGRRRRGAKFCARKSSTMRESTVTAWLPSFFIVTDLR